MQVFELDLYSVIKTSEKFAATLKEYSSPHFAMALDLIVSMY